jgi:hypothetical protein
MEMVFPPNWTGKEEIILCVLNNQPSEAVKKVGEGVSSGEMIYFHQDKDMTHA